MNDDSTGTVQPTEVALTYKDIQKIGNLIAGQIAEKGSLDYKRYLFDLYDRFTKLRESAKENSEFLLKRTK